jgi:hypothetical protein
MFKYRIHKEADNVKFKETCEKLIRGVDNLTPEEPLIDVDGTIIQKFTCWEGNITIFNDYEIDAVYIDSDINLDDILK